MPEVFKRMNDYVFLFFIFVDVFFYVLLCFCFSFFVKNACMFEVFKVCFLLRTKNNDCFLFCLFRCLFLSFLFLSFLFLVKTYFIGCSEAGFKLTKNVNSEATKTITSGFLT